VILQLSSAIYPYLSTIYDAIPVKQAEIRAIDQRTRATVHVRVTTITSNSKTEKTRASHEKETYFLDLSRSVEVPRNAMFNHNSAT